MVDFTVAIPTYNGEKRLPELLERLRSQTGTEHFTWEIIVVDNNSADNTANVVREYQANWPTTSLLKYSFEAEQGAAFARQRAVEEARGTFIGFLDDDNLPSANWVAAAYAFGQAHPRIGAYGSQIHGQFETEPPEYLKKFACFLAIIERGSQAHRYEPKKKMLPPGAGLVVRKQAWRENVPRRLVLNHKGKESGLASEDLEALLHIQQAGWEIWYNPQMCVYHQIPHWRLEREHLISLVRCVGLSRHRIRMLSIKAWQRPLAFFAYLLNDLRRLMIHQLKYRSTVKSDLIAACEMELLWSSLVSPFYLWRKRYLDI
jgi:glycosyltransferase involved in cell wall biosynthesis